MRRRRWTMWARITDVFTEQLRPGRHYQFRART